MTAPANLDTLQAAAAIRQQSIRECATGSADWDVGIHGLDMFCSACRARSPPHGLGVERHRRPSDGSLFEPATRWVGPRRPPGPLPSREAHPTGCIGQD